MRLADLRPGWRTDFITHAVSSEVIEREDCLVVRTAGNPTFYWGNCLVLPRSPRDEDVAHWLSRFEAEVSTPLPAARHVAIGVDAPREGREFPAWRAAGFDVVDTTMLSLRPGQAVPPAPPTVPATLRTLDFAAEGEALIDLELTDATEFEPEGYRDYRRRRQAVYAQLQAQGQALWFGLWCEGQLAAACGLMRDAAAPGAIARFQHVLTHPQWRRRGLCRTLVHAVSAHALGEWQAAEVYMAAVPTDVAIGIYRSLGFRPASESFMFQRNAPEDRHGGCSVPGSVGAW